MRKGVQKLIAIGVMGLGVAVGLSIGSSKAPVRAQNSPAAQDLPPPQDFNPADFQMPPDGAGAVPPSPPVPPGGVFPPGETPVGPQAAPSDEMLPFKTENPEGFVYNPEGLRDPFFPYRKGNKGVELPAEEAPAAQVEFNPQDPLQAYPLNEYRLVGILWDVKEPRAMVQTPNGKVFSIRKKIRLGREGAVVAAVRESEIVVVQPNADGSYVNASTRVISMKK